MYAMYFDIVPSFFIIPTSMLIAIFQQEQETFFYVNLDSAYERKHY